MGEAQDRGARFERRFAEMVGGELVPGSGSGVVKLDVRGGEVLWSCKATKHNSYSVTRHTLEEIRRATRGPGGVGKLGGLAVELGDGTVFAMFFAPEMLEFLSEAEPAELPRVQSRKAGAATPASLRGSE